MGRDQCGDIAVPTPEQYGRAPVIRLRQTESAVLLRHFDSECADGGKSIEVFLWNFAGPIDLVRIDMVAQIRFQFLQKRIARRAILRALFGIGMDPIEIVTADE